MRFRVPAVRAAAILGVATVVAGCGGTDAGPDANAFDFGPIHVDYGFDGQADAFVPWDAGPDATSCQNENDCPDPESPFCDRQVGVCVGCRGVNDCLGRGYCVQGRCNDDLVCQPSQRTCSRNKARICNEDGSDLVEVDCGEQVCFEGQCVNCAPGSVDCPEINVARTCRLDGSGWEETQCGDLRCVNGACVACVPGHKVCQGSSVMSCTLDGSGFAFTEDCDTENTGRLCHLGTCLNLCEFNAKFKTNQGCEYWATDLDQYREAGSLYNGGVDSPFAIVVSNINQSFKATVRVTNASGFDQTYEAPPKTATILSLPSNNIEGSGISDRAWHLTSNLPIVAYQFNPLENVKVYSNDSSLLLPTTALGKKYRVMAWPTIGVNADFQMLASMMTVVAVEDGETQVSVTPTAAVQSGSGVPAMPKGIAKSFTLQKGQVLNLESSNVGEDFTGSYIEADKKVSVFGGHVCANAPISTCKGGRCSYDPSALCTVDDDCPSIAACDHLEEQIQPLTTWGKHYVVARTMPRGKAPDVIRVLAAQDGTVVTPVPAVTSIPMLNAGQWHEFEITDHVELTSEKPFLVGQFLEGQNAPYSAHAACVNYTAEELCEEAPGSCMCTNNLNTCTKQVQCEPNDANIGDPAFILGVPTEQFRKEYVFLVPVKYRNNYLSIVAPTGANVTLDGGLLPQSQFQPLTSGKYMVTRLPMVPGSHTLSSDKYVGIWTYGWDFYVSYGCPGGMNIETLTVYQ